MQVTIALPMYGGANAHTVGSLLSLQHALLSAGHGCRVDIEAGGSIITKVRNRLVRRFLDSKDDILVFIDADMVFDAKDVLALVESGAEISCINYRARKDDVVWMNRPVIENGELVAIRENGRPWVKNEAAGTGMMAIRRSALEKMAKAHAHLGYEDSGETLALFDFSLNDGHYYGEDYLFCRRWLAIGGEIWTLADATIGHVGEKIYWGNYCESLGGVRD